MPVNAEEKIIAEIHDSFDVALMALRQIEGMSSLFDETVASPTQSVDDAISRLLASSEKINATLNDMLSAHEQGSAGMLTNWPDAIARADSVLHDASAQLLTTVKSAGNASAESREKRLKNARDRLLVYAEEYRGTTISFGKSASKLSSAIDKLTAKRSEIAGQLKRIEGGDDIKKLDTAVAVSIRGKKTVERERYELEARLHDKRTNAEERARTRAELKKFDGIDDKRSLSEERQALEKDLRTKVTSQLKQMSVKVTDAAKHGKN